MFQFIGYAPDLAPDTPGVITECTSLVPSLKGMKGAPSPQTRLLPALAAACRGAAALMELDEAVRVIAGTTTDLYEAGSTSWTERTRASGDYSLGTADRWCFAQRGDETFAAAKSEILQLSDTDVFDDADADAPEAAVVFIVNGFIMLLNVNDQGALFDSAERPHGWWAARAADTWTPSVANEAYTGELSSSPGPLTGGAAFGDLAIAFKQRSMFRGVYAGQSGWVFEQIPGTAGALAHGAIVDVGTAEDPVLLFMGFEDFYRFDGSRPVSIGNPIKETVFAELNRAATYSCQALHDRKNSRVYFYYPVNSTSADKCVVYNYKTGKWGRDDRMVEAVLEWTQPGVTYQDLGNLYSTYADFPSLSYDTAFLSAGVPVPAIFNTSHVMQTLDGNTTSSSMTIGDYGSDELLMMLSRVQLHFLTKPTSASMTNFYRSNLGDALTQDQVVSMDTKGRFDVLRSANWHRASFVFTGNVEFPGIEAVMAEDGGE